MVIAMKNLKLKVLSLSLALLMLIALAGCKAEKAATPQSTADVSSSVAAPVKEQITVHLSVIDKDGAKLLDEDIKADDGAIALDVLKDAFKDKGGVDDSAGYITAIGGVKEDVGAKISWMYYVNGGFAPVGAGEYKLKANDKVEFKLESWA
jgi:ABC-type glycerol-3-phosphate transport system substrate-binding protein